MEGVFPTEVHTTSSMPAKGKGKAKSKGGGAVGGAEKGEAVHRTLHAVCILSGVCVVARAHVPGPTAWSACLCGMVCPLLTGPGLCPVLQVGRVMAEGGRLRREEQL